MDWKKIFASRAVTVALIALVTVFAIHVIAQNAKNVRLDMTADDLYSLSPGTLAILEKMHEEGVKPIEVKLYFSETAGKTLPRFIKQFITYESYLEALLKAYEVAGKGKVKVSFFDPVPDSDDAQDAEDYGLDGKPINQEGDLFFFGLVLETQTGSRDKIEFLWPNQQETVEYEITKRVHSLIWPTRKHVGVLSGLEVLSEADNPYMRQVLAAQGRSPRDSWISMQLLQEQYDVSRVDSDTDHISPDEHDLLIVAHPKHLGHRALWAIDEWVQRGGNTLVFVDPYAIEDQPPPNPQNQFAQFQYDPSSDLGQMLARWGVELRHGDVAADLNLAVRRPVRQRGPAEQVIVDLAIDEGTRDQTLNAASPVLKGLNDLRFFMAGSLVKASPEGEDEDENGITLTPLITTTAQGGALHMEPGFPEDDKLVFLDLNEPTKLIDHFAPGDRPVVLAYEIHGRLPSLYPEGVDVPEETPAPPPGLPPGIELPPPPGGQMIHKDPVPEEERQPATVLLFADVDFISDPLAFQQTPFGAIAANDNHKVLLNAVDYLFGSKELMQVRSKAAIARPFTLFDEIESQANADMLEREKNLRADVDRFQEELRGKQSKMSVHNAALFQKQVQDEVDELNRKIRESNAELREIRKEKRAALEGEETFVRATTLGLTPALVLLLGLGLFFRRRWRDFEARRSN